MAHQKKYYKDIESAGHSWRLEIWQDIPLDEYGEPTQTLIPVEIGPVLQSLRLVVQGDQASIDTPIVKTSLEMSFVDAPGLEYERKCGYWEEFYTSSATEYQVKLYKDSALEWSGYITPDSFAEDLRYRGSVSLIARDNLGTLQDVTFDMLDSPNIDGKVYVNDVIQRAMAVSTCAMNLSWNEGDLPKAVGLPSMKTSGSGHLMQQMVDIRVFKDKDWWTALEDILYAVGLVLRYIGGNRLRLMAVRDLPKGGQASWLDVPRKEASFLAYGRRELVPGIKSIKETIDYELELEDDNEGISSYVENQHSTMTEIGNLSVLGPSGYRPRNFPVHGYKKNKINQYVMPEYSPLLDVSAYEKVAGESSEEYGKWDDTTIVYYAVNGAEDRPVDFVRKIYSSDLKAAISFNVDKAVTVTQDLKGVMNLPVDEYINQSGGLVLKYRILLRDNSLNEKYFDAAKKTWGTDQVTNSADINPIALTVDKPSKPTEVKIEDIPITTMGTLYFQIVSIYKQSIEIVVRRDCLGFYLRIKDITINLSTNSGVGLLTKDTLTTEYDSKYSVRLTRSPELGINPTTRPEIAYVPKAILAEGVWQYYGAKQWVWPLGRATLPTTGISLPRLIHQQLLAYNAKPNSVLTGELIDAGGELPDWNSIWMWNGKEHTLMSGTLNILTGRMEGAVLREFTRYDHMWETWVENDDIRVDYTLSAPTFYVHSNNKITADSFVGDVTWILQRNPVYNEETKVWECKVTIYPNKTGAERVARFKIDGAEVRVTQGYNENQ